MSQLHTNIKDENKKFLDQYCASNGLKQNELLNRLLEELKQQEENKNSTVTLKFKLHYIFLQVLLDNYSKHSWNLQADFEDFVNNSEKWLGMLTDTEIIVSKECYEDAMTLVNNVGSNLENLFISYLHYQHLKGSY